MSKSPSIVEAKNLPSITEIAIDPATDYILSPSLDPSMCTTIAKEGGVHSFSKVEDSVLMEPEQRTEEMLPEPEQ